MVYWPVSFGGYFTDNAAIVMNRIHDVTWNFKQIVSVLNEFSQPLGEFRFRGRSTGEDGSEKFFGSSSPVEALQALREFLCGIRMHCVECIHHHDEIFGMKREVVFKGLKTVKNPNV